MKPFDLLTEEDKDLICQYVRSYSGANPMSIEAILAEWNKNKKRLLKIFGNQLRVSVPVEYTVGQRTLTAKLDKSYQDPSIHCVLSYLNESVPSYGNIFIDSVTRWLRGEYIKDNISFEDSRNFLHLLYKKQVASGSVYESYTFTNLNNEKRPSLTIPKGTKIMKAVRKVLEYYGYSSFDLFIDWRDEVSVILTSKKVKTNLTFSIHPIDFMTMSDNECHWRSCMNWRKNGGYSTGTIEMMNSNVAVVVYTESSRTKFTFNGHYIPNKNWRTLMFIHKDILLVGKHYPYQNANLAKLALSNIQPIIRANISWKYQYKMQLYKDLIRSRENSYVKHDLNRWGRERYHKIFCYMNVMYNDMIYDHDTPYWCCRNYVKKSLYLNLSGQATCMSCGKRICTEPGYEDEIESSVKYCYDCYQKYGCTSCKHVDHSQVLYKISVRNKYYSRPIEKKVCLNCLTNFFLFNKEEECFVYSEKYMSPENLVRKNIPITREVLNKYAVRVSI